MDSSRPTGIDLHIHSTASDGTLTPSQILSTAQRLHLGAIAITDHDTLEGSRAALAAGIPHQLIFLTGVEISAAPPSGFDIAGSIHILGYCIDLDNPGLIKTLEVLRESREERNPKILRQLKRLGLHLSEQEVRAQVGDAMAGRPHVAAAMVAKGLVDSIDEAFDRFLGKGQPAYVDKYRIPAREAIQAIAAAGGVPVLAHPYLTGLAEDEVAALLLDLKSAGLKGVEVYYPEHPPRCVTYYLALAAQHDLLVTGGTDFHGDVTPEIQMGTGLGDLHVPVEVYDGLRKATACMG